MFSSKLKKISLRGRIDLNSPEDIVPTIVAKMPAFGRKKSTDKLSLFSDAIYEENLPFCDGRERHTVSDAYINYYVKEMIHDYRALGHLDDFEFERCYTPKHGSTWIIRSNGDDSINRLLKVLEKVVKEDKLDILAHDLYDLRTLATAKVFVSRSITKTCYMARHQECLIFHCPGLRIPPAVVKRCRVWPSDI